MAVASPARASSHYLSHNSPTKMTSSNKVPFPPTLNQSTMCSMWDNLRQLGRQNYTGCIAQGTGGRPWDRKGLYDLTWHGSAGYWYNGLIWVIAMAIFLRKKL